VSKLHHIEGVLADRTDRRRYEVALEGMATDMAILVISAIIEDIDSSLISASRAMEDMLDILDSHTTDASQR
jgi:hypothetical protein